MGVTGATVSQRADVQQLEETKRTLEGQLEEIRLQLETDGYTSMAQMRCIFVSEILRKLSVVTIVQTMLPSELF